MSAVTVVVPVYNVAGYLRAALDSLLSQDVREWDAVCVDDGSTDGSGKILDEYAARDARLTVVHQSNGGVSVARNAALDRATGEVVAFLDPDDVVAPDWLSTLQEGIEGVDLVWGGMTMDQAGKGSYDGPQDVGAAYRGDEVRQRVWRAVFGYRLRDLMGYFLPGGMWRRCRREFGVVMCRAIRRSVIGDVRFDARVRLCEDALFLSAVAKRAQSMRVIGDTGYRYFVRQGGAMMTERRNRMVPYRFAARDIRREIDPKMTHWRGSFLLSAADILRRSGLTAFLRYVAFLPCDKRSGALVAVALAFLSGCAFFGSDETAVEYGEEIVADEVQAATNDVVDVSPPVAGRTVTIPPVASPPVASRPVASRPVTSLSVADRPSPNFDKRTLPVSLIVLHYTAAPLKESLNALRDGRGTSRVSCHYLVSENGTIYRLVDETNRAWHAGVSKWGGITDVNSASIGIEMVNLGHDRFGRSRPYRAEQVEAVTRLCLDIQSRYDITDVVGHSDVAPTRKIDPGELFPWRMLFDRGVKVSAKGFVRQPHAR